MQIGIIGAGRIGATIAHLLTASGQSVMISRSKGPDSLARLIHELGPNAQAGTPAQAVSFGQIVVLAAPWTKRQELPEPRLFAGKILVDAMNPYSADFRVIDLGDSTSSFEVARQFPGARVVKAFNTLYWETLATRGTKHVSHRLILPLAGDDPEAKQTVADLISQSGFTPFDSGDLRTGGELQEPGRPLYNKALTVKEAAEILAGTRAK